MTSKAWRVRCVAGVVALVASAALAQAPAGPARGWLEWRGPLQNGVSTETGLPDQVDPAKALWTYDLPGRGAPVIAGDRLYTLGYQGEGAALQEVLVCLNAATGEKIWERRFSDFLSDIIYTRYAIGSPAVDAETGNVYVVTAPGLMLCFDRDGKELWRHSLMEELGRLTFPNGRTGSPAIDGDLVIVHMVTSNWGADGPGRDRFYAFDKTTGRQVWASTPGIAPQDNSFATPVFDWYKGQRVFYAGTGCGHVVCINARTGQTLWRYRVSLGGLNGSLVLHTPAGASAPDTVIAVNGKENVDSSETGRMVAVKIPAELPVAKPPASAPGTQPASQPAGPPDPPTLDRSSELWRTLVCATNSSPVLVGDRAYVVDDTGELMGVDVTSGKVLWKLRVGPDQLHASPLYADGKLYVPSWHDGFWVIRPEDSGPKVLAHAQLAGECIGSPAVWNGRLYIQTTEKLYCFGSKDGAASLPAEPATAAAPPVGPPAALQVLPYEVLLRPGSRQPLTVYAIDAAGQRVGPVEKVTWSKYIPPTARVRAEMDATVVDGSLVAADDAKPSAGMWQAVATTADGRTIKGFLRGRVVKHLPMAEGFDTYELTETDPAGGAKFAYPPLPWIGARFKFDVRELDGQKVLAKTLDNPLFQRAMVFLGAPVEKNYTLEADVMTDGNRRSSSEVGLINQRYVIQLKGNAQEIEVNSNHERLKVAAPFEFKAKTWYRLKTQVEVKPDGSGVVRGKAWPRGTPEPEKWSIEVPVPNVHTEGSPGLFAFTPSNKFKVYFDNVAATPNGK